jgi:integral membrane protein (TIGR01906 family)
MQDLRQLAIITTTIIFSVSALLLVFFLNYLVLISSQSYIGSLEDRTATPFFANPALNYSEAQEVSSSVVSYVRGDSKEFSSASFFTAVEVSHLSDVRTVMTKISRLALPFAAAAAVSIFLVVFLSRNNWFFALKKAVLISGIACVMVSIVLFLASFLDFSSLFVSFHHFFFPQGNWQFPENYLIINLFTEEFFSAFAKDIVIGALINGIALVLAALTIGYAREMVKRRELEK